MVKWIFQAMMKPPQGLGGNSLLDCVVFGRVAGKAACKFTFGQDEKFKPCPVPKELKELTK